MKSSLILFCALFLPAIAFCQHYVFSYNASGVDLGKKAISFTAASDNVIRNNETPLTTLSSNYFRKQKKIVGVDYASMTIKEVTTANYDSIRELGFIETPSKFTSNGVFIEASIWKKKIHLSFETALSEGLVLKHFKGLKFTGRIKTSATVDFFSDAQFDRYANRGIMFLGSIYGNFLHVSENASSSIGYEFIKGFDWIFDFRNKIVYARKNAISIGLNIKDLR